MSPACMLGKDSLEKLLGSKEEIFDFMTESPKERKYHKVHLLLKPSICFFYYWSEIKGNLGKSEKIRESQGPSEKFRKNNWQMHMHK